MKNEKMTTNITPILVDTRVGQRKDLDEHNFCKARTCKICREREADEIQRLTELHPV